MSLEEKIASFFESRVYGPGHFSVQAATLRTLIKFFEDHQRTISADSPLRKCLAALEAGEKSAAVAQHKRIDRSKSGIADWIPPVVCSCETPESVLITFMCLLVQWQRDMSSLAGDRPVT